MNRNNPHPQNLLQEKISVPSSLMKPATRPRSASLAFHRTATQTFWHQPLVLVLVLGLAAVIARADPAQMMGTITIDDLGEGPITVVASGGTNQMTVTGTADQATPETVMFSLDVDGTITPGMGVALMLGEGGVISDVLQVTLTQRMRGMNIPYFTISGTFTSDAETEGETEGGGIPALGLTPEVMDAAMARALYEDGTQQNIGARLVDTTTGMAFGIDGVTITAASQVPEPSTWALLGIGIAALLAFRRRKAKAA